MLGRKPAPATDKRHTRKTKACREVGAEGVGMGGGGEGLQQRNACSHQGDSGGGEGHGATKGPQEHEEAQRGER